MWTRLNNNRASDGGTAMRYLALIYDKEKTLAGLSEDEREKRHKSWYAYSSDLAQSGKLLAGDALQSTESATTVRVQNEESVVSDGPFAETKEQLGGYFLIDAKDLDDAI